MHTEEKELKPCPFCGGTNLHMRHEKEYDLPSMNDEWSIGCLSVSSDGWVCGAVLTCGGSKKQAIEKWNRRCRTFTQKEK